jgi:uncharacterized protein YecE (DUF72 family)
MTVYVGTAGFSYTDWKGPFYPRDIRKSSMLEGYARHFPVVEINSTYYAIPEPQRLNAMAARTPPWFLFNVKANREMTHEIGNANRVFDDFAKAIRPLLDHGKLGCVLAQFPWGFKRTAANERYLEELAARTEGMDTVVEFRNSQWEDDETLDRLAALGLGYVCVDEPRLQGLLSGRVAITGKTAYVRMHGRNEETWWDRGRESWERYDYLYSEEELAEWLPKVEKMNGQADRVYVIFNNHYKGQAPANARTFEQMLRAILGSDVYIVDDAGSEGAGTLFD